MSRDELLIILAAIVVFFGIFMGVKGKSSMIRERFGSGVSPENERKFMMTIGGAISIIGLDLLVLGILPILHPVTEETVLVILGIGIILFVAVLLIGQKYFRR